MATKTQATPEQVEVRDKKEKVRLAMLAKYSVRFAEADARGDIDMMVRLGREMFKLSAENDAGGPVASSAEATAAEPVVFIRCDLEAAARDGLLHPDEYAAICARTLSPDEYRRLWELRHGKDTTVLLPRNGREAPPEQG
jgi:hypothetical protein